MSDDHKDSGWRKRQIALDKKAENARELGLDYEPSIMDMAREAGFEQMGHDSSQEFTARVEHFAELVREDEREACAKVCADGINAPQYPMLSEIAAAIRARGQA